MSRNGDKGTRSDCRESSASFTLPFNRDMDAPGGPGNTGAGSGHQEAAAGPPRRQVRDLSKEQRAKLEQVPPKYRALYRKAWSGRSRKAAIRAFCMECVCYSPAEVERCSSPCCPLSGYRLKG